ncbi:MAG: class I SAM-dependent methyltransferase [Colwellia sp.]|nr:class I SAM-dependent methyltransferase [Colwellia sp.]
MKGDDQDSILIPLNAKIQKVLKGIEQEEKDWVINNYKDDHTYGRIPGEKEIRFWSIPASTGLFLYNMIIAKKPKVILEIGTSAAYSTIWMGAAAASYGGRVFTIDICPEKQVIAERNINDASLCSTISLLKGEALHITKEWDEGNEIDFLFLDADKENYIQYLNNLISKMDENFILCADNAIDYRPLMQNFLTKAHSMKDYDSMTLNIDNGLFLMCPKS